MNDTNSGTDLKKIYKSSLKFLTPLSVGSTCKIISQEAMKLTSSNFSSVFLKKGANIERAYSSSEKLYKIKIRERGFTFRSISAKEPFVVDINQVEKIHPLVKDMGIKSTIFIPLSYKSEHVGVLSLDSFKAHKLTQKEKELLDVFSSFASLAIRKAQLYDDVRLAIEKRDFFISTANHELRTPLTTVSVYSELLEKKLKLKGYSEHALAEQLYWEIKRLTMLIGELLKIEQIKKGKFEYNLKPVRLNELIKRTTTGFEATHPGRKLVVENNIGSNRISFMGDFDKILQVVNNLLNNAAKFSDKSKPILLVFERKRSSITFKVVDEGLGISKKEMRHVFDEYFKGKHKRSGMGIGLFLVKSIVERHGGKINIFSKVNRGTTVQVSIPKYING